MFLLLTIVLSPLNNSFFLCVCGCRGLHTCLVLMTYILHVYSYAICMHFVGNFQRSDKGFNTKLIIFLLENIQT